MYINVIVFDMGAILLIFVPKSSIAAEEIRTYFHYLYPPWQYV